MRRGDQSQRRGLGPANGAVGAGLHGCRINLIARADSLDGFGIVCAFLEDGQVRIANGRAVVKLLADPRLRGLKRTRVHPERKPQRKHVLRAIHLLLRQIGIAERLAGERRERYLDDFVAIERVVVERVGVGPVCQLQVAGRKGVGVHEHRAARPHPSQVHLERRRVHGHEQVHLIAGRVDIHRAKVQLESAHAVGRPRRSADLRRIVGQRGQVVAGIGRGQRKLRAR